MNNLVRTSSIIAFDIRLICIALAVYGGYLVVKQYRRGSLQPIRTRLTLSLAFIVISNVPVEFIHYNKIVSRATSVDLSSATAIVNSLGLLIATIALVSIIRFRIKE